VLTLIYQSRLKSARWAQNSPPISLKTLLNFRADFLLSDASLCNTLVTQGVPPVASFSASLSKQRFLFIDCQTTGMHPSIGQLLELAWCYTSADELALVGTSAATVHSALVDTGHSLPWRVQEITGLKAADLLAARPLDDVRAEFQAAIAAASADGPLWAIIHYAQFERGFLEPFLDGLPFQILCTHMIAKRLFPQAPSRNIRALSGFLGAHIGDVKRAAEHVRATLEIWQGLQTEISSLGLSQPDGLLDWSKSATTKRPKVGKASYEYRVDRDKRLALPARPGVYRMLSKTGRILYVGKATCLKDRVNSYFRGKRGRDPRKLEMMAQTWDLQITECASALEAAVLESDEIKKHDPPYNVRLKSTRRRLLFYSDDFESSSEAPDDAHVRGPFRAMNPIEELRALLAWRAAGAASGAASGITEGGGHLFYGLYDDELVQQGYEVFALAHPVVGGLESLRSHLAYGLSLWRAGAGLGADASDEVAVEAAEVADVAADDETGDDITTPEEMAEKFARTYFKAAYALVRTRLINRLMNSRVQWRENEKDFALIVRAGHLLGADTAPALNDKQIVSWSSLTIADYDRMSVLASELNARDGQILPAN
jgi:DNA polymerase-3 subunit epsilon